MAYKITFDKSRKALYSWTDVEKQSTLWKKGLILDEIIIKPTGRCIYSNPFRENIIYKIYDYGILQEKDRRNPLEVVLILKKGVLDSVVIPAFHIKKYSTRPFHEEVLDAILCADKQYSKTGGGVLYKTPLYKNTILVMELKDMLLKIK